MRRISSRATFLYKRVFPTIWFGFLALFIALPLIGGWTSGQFPPALFFIMPALMAAVGYFFMKKLLFDLVDEVLDAGDALIIRNRDREERIALSEIVNVSYTSFMNPPRVTLLLRKSGTFGRKIAFCAPVRALPSMTSPVIDELIERIVVARGA